MPNYAIDTIRVVNRKRQLGDVSILAKSIQDIGLLHPITIRRDGTLVAGMHRLAACKQLGWTEIPVHILDIDGLQAELAEIDENLIRSDLSVLDRAEHLKRRKEIYVALHPETHSVTVRGGPGRGKTNEMISLVSTPAFTEDTATKTGQTRRSIETDVQIATNLSDDVKDAVRDTDLADNAEYNGIATKTLIAAVPRYSVSFCALLLASLGLCSLLVWCGAFSLLVDCQRGG